MYKLDSLLRSHNHQLPVKGYNYLVNCMKCNIQGIGSTTQFNKRISIFHISSNEKEHAALLNISLTTIGKKNRKSCLKKIMFQIIGISKLTNKPTNAKLTSTRSERILRGTGRWDWSHYIHMAWIKLMNWKNAIKDLEQSFDPQLFRIITFIFYFQWATCTALYLYKIDNLCGAISV